MQPIPVEERQELADQFREAAEVLPSPHVIIHGNVIASEGQFAAFLRSASPVAVPEIRERLRELRNRADEARAREQKDAEEDAARVASRQPLAPGDLEFEEARERERDAAKAAAYRASTEGRLEAIEGLLARIADGLERRG